MSIVLPSAAQQHDPEQAHREHAMQKVQGRRPLVPARIGQKIMNENIALDNKRKTLLLFRPRAEAETTEERTGE